MKANLTLMVLCNIWKISAENYNNCIEKNKLNTIFLNLIANIKN